MSRTKSNKTVSESSSPEEIPLPSISRVAKEENIGSRFARFRGAWVVLFLLVTRIVRVALAFDPARPFQDGNDADQYAALAHSLWHRGELRLMGHLTSLRTPGYPALIVLSWWIGRPHHYAVLIFIQIILSVLTGWWVYLLAERVYGARAAVAAGVLFAIDPLMMQRVPRVASEVAFAFCIPLFVLLFTEAQERYSPWKWAGAVASLLAGFYIRADMIACFGGVVLLAMGYPLLTRRPLGAWTLRRGLLAILLVAAGMSPWVYRNWKVHHRFVPLSTYGSFNLFTKLGAHGGEFGWGLDDVHYDPNDLLQLKKDGEARMDRIFFRAKWASAARHPWQATKIVFRNFLQMFYPIPLFNLPLYDPVFGFEIVFFAFGLWAIGTRVRSGRTEPLPLLVCFLGLLALMCLTAGQSRYRNSTQPLFLAIAGGGLAWCGQRWTRRKFAWVVGAVASVQIVLFVVMRGSVHDRLVAGFVNLFGF